VKFTKQQTFDIVVKGLAAQGFERALATDSYSSCMYRDDKGRKCAAGQLIPDELYNPEMEKMGSICYIFDDDFDRDRYSLYELSGLVEHDRKLLIDLQDAHDLSMGSTVDRDALLRVAVKHELTIPQELAE